MKLTTSQLRKLIKEEVTAAVREANGSGGSIKEQLLDGLMQLQIMFAPEEDGGIGLSDMAVKLDAERKESGADARYPGPYTYASKKSNAQFIIGKIWEHIDHAIQQIEEGE